MYVILPYTKKRAKLLKLIIEPSKKKNKKIDVYDKNGYFIVSIGALGSMDYAYYLKYYGKPVAEERRRLYKIRHKKDRLAKGTAGYYADKLLWT
jgi:hypothetical protein